jgi:hypothetical protein
MTRKSYANPGGALFSIMLDAMLATLQPILSVTHLPPFHFLGAYVCLVQLAYHVSACDAPMHRKWDSLRWIEQHAYSSSTSTNVVIYLYYLAAAAAAARQYECSIMRRATEARVDRLTKQE